MYRPSLPLAATVSALLLSACSNTSLPALPFITPAAPASAPAEAAAAPAPAAPVKAEEPKPPSALAEFEAAVAGLASESGVKLERQADGALLLRAVGDAAFAPSGTALTPRFNGFLKQLAGRLAQAQSLNVKVTGHTDATGNAKRNDKLSEGRAQAAARVLTQNGVADFRVSASGKGKREPVASNDTAVGRASNRRVDIAITEGR